MKKKSKKNNTKLVNIIIFKAEKELAKNYLQKY